MPAVSALGVGEVGDDVGVEAVAVADEAQPHALALQLGDLVAQVMAQQAGEVEDLAGGAAPVLAAEGVQREPADAVADRRLDGAANRLGAGAMAGDARQAARRGPAAVAVHDDGDMARRRRPDVPLGPVRRGPADRDVRPG